MGKLFYFLLLYPIYSRCLPVSCFRSSFGTIDVMATLSDVTGDKAREMKIASCLL